MRVDEIRKLMMRGSLAVAWSPVENPGIQGITALLIQLETKVSVLKTQRLQMRELHREDAAFMHELVNEPAWLRFIGDRGVDNLEDARAYIQRLRVESYERYGFGMYVVEITQTGEAIGLCGLVKRDSLEDVDIGFAFLAAHRGRGYALESSEAVLEHTRRDLGLSRLLAIVTPDNARSISLLEKLGFVFERTDHVEDEELQVFARAL